MEETIKTQPTESQVQVLMSDWMGNLRQKEEGNFTHAGSHGITHDGDESFSSYLIGDVDGLDEIELIRQARSAAKQVVNAIVSEPTDIHVGGADSYHSYNGESRTINLATDYFDDPDLTPREKVDIMLGIASHESAHAVYTDQETKMKHLEEETELAGLKKTVWNIIEDERIEYHLGEKRPGLAQTLGTMKGYFFKKLVQDLRLNGELPTEPIPKLLSALTQAVRYPSEMTREEVIDNFDELDAIRHALTPYPLTPEEAWEATDRVMDVIRDTAKKELEKQRQEQQQQQGGGGTPAPQNPGGSGQNGEEENQQQEQQSGGGQQPPSPSKEEIDQAVQQALGTDQGQQVMKALEKDEQKCDGTDGQNSARVIEDDDEDSQYVNQDDAEVMGGGPGDPQTYVFKPKGNPEEYNKSLRKVKPYIPAMSRALACKSRDSHYVLHGLPAGKLNTNRLVSLKCGNTNIFDRKGSVVCSSASVCMLIDESGSMHGEKLKRTREAAILVKEAIDRIKNVRFYCYGYTDDRITVFSESPRTNRFALSETAAVGGTPTGLAMRRAAERVRRQTSDPVLMLVLTDGGADNNQEVIDQEAYLSGKGFSVIGVGIQSNAVRHSFREHIVVNDISSFAVELGKLTKGKLDRMLVRHDA